MNRPFAVQIQDGFAVQTKCVGKLDMAYHCYLVSQ